MILLTMVAVGPVSMGQIPQQTLRPTEGAVSFQNASATDQTYTLHLGAFVAAKVGVNTTVAHGRKTDANFNTLPDFGISLFAPFSVGGRIGAGIDIGYATYTYRNKPVSNPTDANTIVERYSYVNIFPHLNLSGFVLGLNIGVVPQGSAETLAGSKISVITSGQTELDGTQLSTLLELRVGANIPVLYTSSGHFNVYFLGGYVLSGLYSDYSLYRYSWDNFTTPSADNNPRPASLAVGLAYYFDFPLK